MKIYNAVCAFYKSWTHYATERPVREQVNMIPLREAVLCVNCDVVSKANGLCPACEGRALHHIADWLQRKQQGSPTPSKEQQGSQVPPIEVPTTHDWIELPNRTMIEGARIFQRGSLRVIVSRDGAERVWHISISCPHRYPGWKEIKKARYDLIPDNVAMAMFFPPLSEYVNIHPNCFHLYEIERHR